MPRKSALMGPEQWHMDRVAQEEEKAPIAEEERIKGLSPWWYGLSTGGQLADAYTTLQVDPAHEQNPVGRFMLKSPPLTHAIKGGIGLGAGFLGNKVFKEGKRTNSKFARVAGKLIPTIVGLGGLIPAYYTNKNIPKKKR